MLLKVNYITKATNSFSSMWREDGGKREERGREEGGNREVTER
jgi:hypothetical protein